MIKLVTHAHLGPIWYHSETSDFPYCPNQFLALDFFCHFLEKDGSNVLFLSMAKVVLIGFNARPEIQIFDIIYII